MRKKIGVRGEIMDTEMNDMIATLEQENRQLHARNTRLEEDLTRAEEFIFNLERHPKRDVTNDAFEYMRKLVREIGGCFAPDSTQAGVLLMADVHTDNIKVYSINASTDTVHALVGLANIHMSEAAEAINDPDRVLN